MSCAVKLQLENQIFARAARLHAAVYSRSGGLYASSTDRLLTALLYVYNAYFRAENYRLYCARSENLQPLSLYRRQCSYFPGLVRTYGRTNLNFELLVGGSHEKNKI